MVSPRPKLPGVFTVKLGTDRRASGIVSSLVCEYSVGYLWKMKATTAVTAAKRLTDLYVQCELVSEPFESSVPMHPLSCRALAEFPCSPSLDDSGSDGPFSSSLASNRCSDEGELLLYRRRGPRLEE